MNVHIFGTVIENGPGIGGNSKCCSHLITEKKPFISLHVYTIIAIARGMHYLACICISHGHMSLSHGHVCLWPFVVCRGSLKKGYHTWNSYNIT